MTNGEVQEIAKQTMIFIRSQIKVGLNLQELPFVRKDGLS